jgi:hypothetical protein
MLNWFHGQLGILKFKYSIIWIVQLFYFMSNKQKMLNWNWSLVCIIEKFDYLNWFFKIIELKKVYYVVNKDNTNSISWMFMKDLFNPCKIYISLTLNLEVIFYI